MTLAPAPLDAVGPDGLLRCGRYQGLAGAPGWAQLATPRARTRPMAVKVMGRFISGRSSSSNSARVTNLTTA